VLLYSYRLIECTVLLYSYCLIALCFNTATDCIVIYSYWLTALYCYTATDLLQCVIQLTDCLTDCTVLFYSY